MDKRWKGSEDKENAEDEQSKPRNRVKSRQDSKTDEILRAERKGIKQEVVMRQKQ